jgi:glycerol-3-phosphate dehydrogenase
VWAGLRPLVKSATSGRTADLSRRHRVMTGPAGVIAITGGKLTTYREMAEDTVDGRARGARTQGRCRTKKLKLLGAAGFSARRRVALRDPSGGALKPAAPSSLSFLVRHRPCVRAPRARPSTVSSAISRYVVSFPPVIAITPAGPVITRWRRERSAVRPLVADLTSGRSPAHTR